jgi:hypothetical protein
MALKPIHLVMFPLVLFMLMGVILDSAMAWQSACGLDLSCGSAISIFPHNSPLFLLITGDMSVFWTSIQNPSFTFSMFAAVASVIIGFFLLLMALGMTFEAHVVASGGSIAFNEQATKMAQVLGPGLMIWGMVQLSMSGWEAYFDNYVVGLAVLFNLILEVLYIAGLWWMVHSRF